MKKQNYDYNTKQLKYLKTTQALTVKVQIYFTQFSLGRERKRFQVRKKRDFNQGLYYYSISLKKKKTCSKYNKRSALLILSSKY